MIYLGTAIAPRGVAKEGAKCVRVSVHGGAVHEVPFGELRLVPLPPGEVAMVDIQPAKGFDVGAGPGKALTAKVWGGEVGLVLDARGRPLQMSADKRARYAQLQRWAKALDLYPEKGGPGEKSEHAARAEKAGKR